MKENINNDNKNRDIFYGIVAIATLIVAIVGATLAYFSITANSDEGAVSARAATVSINYDDTTKVVAQADQLIPSKLDVMQYFYELNSADFGENNTTNNCVDANGRQVCSVYRFSASVDSGTKNIVATLNTEDNSFKNLAYAVRDVNCTYSGSINDVTISSVNNTVTNTPYDNCWLNLGTEESPVKWLPLAGCTDGGEEDTSCWTINNTIKEYSESNPRAVNSIFGYGTNNNLTSKEISATPRIFDVVIFLNENNDDQNNEQGAEYSGTLKVEVTGISGNGQITGRVTQD